MKKRGFTLIELLAVIVILAIIALIATPIVMNVIENARESSYDRSVENILNSANMFAMDMKVTEDLELDKNIYDKIVNQLNGNRPEKGQVYVNKYGQIALSLKYGDYCYTKSYGEESYYKEKNDKECITPFYYLKESGNASASDPFLGGPVRSEIEKITTLATNIVPEDALDSWDVGVDENGNAVSGKVMAWYKDQDENGLYEVYIGQEGGVKANPNSNWLFMSLKNVTEMDLSKLDTSNVTSMRGMFYNCNSLMTVDLSGFNTSNVDNMHTMFYACGNLQQLDLGHFDTSNVTLMVSMFSGCNNLASVDLNQFNTTNVTNMSSMFSGCASLTNLDLSSFNTSNATDMSYMFMGTTKLKEILVSKNWTTENANITSIFLYAGTNHVTVQ